jgi:hypothetical protein
LPIGVADVDVVGEESVRIWRCESMLARYREGLIDPSGI